MNKKLTLSIESDIIHRAKKYCKDKNVSLSGLVENYFRKITDQDVVYSEEPLSESVCELLGSVKYTTEDRDYDSLKNDFLEAKYKDE
jgi:hypothetical protein